MDLSETQGFQVGLLQCIEEGFFFPGQSIGKVLYTIKGGFFSWCVPLGMTLTTDNVRKRGLIIMDQFLMCYSHGENVAHTFLCCAVAREMWSLVFYLFGFLGDALFCVGIVILFEETVCQKKKWGDFFFE